MRNMVENKSEILVFEKKRWLRLSGLLLLGVTALGACQSAPAPVNNSASNAMNKDQAVNSGPRPEKSAYPPADNSNSRAVKSTDLPKALIDAGEYAENIYDLAKTKSWKKAEEKETELEKSVGALTGESPGLTQLRQSTEAVKKAVSAKNDLDAMREANQATFVVADLTAEYNPKVPIEVTKLDYYGREIEILVSTNDAAKLKLTAGAIRQTWNAVKPKIDAKGAGKVSAKFESLVVQTENAGSVADYGKVIRPILDEVDNLEKVFE